MKNLVFGFALIFAMVFATTVNAQYTDDTGGSYGDTSGTGDTTGDGQGGYYDPSYQDPAPGYGAQPQPQPQPQPPPPAVTVEASTDNAADDEDDLTGFELGINWAGGSKIGIQPGVMLGKFGIYLFMGMNMHKDHAEATSDDTTFAAWSDPGGGAAHHSGEGYYDEEVTIETMSFHYDVGLAARFYLLEELRAQSPNLYLEIGAGWRDAYYKHNIDWNYTGNEDAFEVTHGDVNGDGDVDDEDIAALEYDRNKTWNRVAKDLDKDARQRNQGMWARVGIGGEYVFVGGFGVAGEVGLDLFWNTPWEEKAVFGYDDDPDADEFDYEYEDVKYHGWAIDFGLYWNLALRYHF
jgi:hypothetical protein